MDNLQQFFEKLTSQGGPISDKSTGRSTSPLMRPIKMSADSTMKKYFTINSNSENANIIIPEIGK